MALMDRLLTFRIDSTKEREQRQVTKNILKLIDIYYDALDAPKKGGAKVSSVLFLICNTPSVLQFNLQYTVKCLAACR